MRNDNSASVYQADSENTVTNAKRLNNFSGSNGEELDNTDWLSTGYIPGAKNTSDGLAKSAMGAKLRRLLNGDISQIETKNQNGGLGSGYQPRNIILLTRIQNKDKRIRPTAPG